MLKLTMLPARQGDALWITYGTDDTEHHLVIDGGPERSGTLRSHIETLKRGKALHVDLLAITHIDNDHIGGVLELLEDLPSGLTFGDIWFNAYRHLLPSDMLGPNQGDRLSKILDDRRLPWNLAFDRGAVVVPAVGPLPRIKRQDGLYVTLLGPDRNDLKRLHGAWSTVVGGPGQAASRPEDVLGRRDDWPPDVSALARKAFESDDGEANGSSIALLIEYDSKRILCSGDAHASRLTSSIDLLPFQEERIELNAFKLSHHGSRKSTSTELLKRVSCDTYLISTNGSYFGHPDAEAIARVLMYGGKNPLLVFNSNGKYAVRWKDGKLKNGPPYRTRFPDGEGADGIEITF